MALSFNSITMFSQHNTQFASQKYLQSQGHLNKKSAQNVSIVTYLGLCDVILSMYLAFL